MSEYQQRLRELLDTVPATFINTNPLPIAIVGRAEIWPCTDAAVVLIYRNPANDINVVTRDALSKSASEFLRLSAASQLFESDGRPTRARFAITGKFDAVILWSAAIILARRDWTYVRSEYDKLIVVGWKADLPSPQAEAVDAFRADFAARNLSIAAAIFTTVQSRSPEHAAASILAQYRLLLETAGREEDLQQFLRGHPVLLYPDYVQSFPKHKLGAELVTDFVFLVQGLEGRQYVFVEIEHPAKRLFTESGPVLG